MKLTIKSDNQVKIIDLNKDLELSAVKGEQYVFSNGFTNYTLNFKDDQQTVSFQFNVDGKVIKIDLKGIVPFLQENSSEIENPTAIIINKTVNEKNIENILQNDDFNGSEIIDKLEALITNPANLGKDLTLISDFQTLIEALDAAAAGGEQGGNNTNGSSFNSIFSPLEDSLNDIGETDIWENLNETLNPVDIIESNFVPQSSIVEPLSITLIVQDFVNLKDSLNGLLIVGETTGLNSGDLITIIFNNSTYNTTVNSDGSYSFTIPSDNLILEDGNYNLIVIGTNSQGETVQIEKNIIVDTTVDTIILDPISEDGYLNAQEANEPLVITGKTDGIEPGQSVTVTLNGKEYTTTVGLDGTFEVTVPVEDVQALEDGEKYEVEAKVEDKAGNETSFSSDVKVDLVTGTLVLNEISDDYLNAIEHGNDLTISGYTTGIESGQVVTITLNGKEYKGNVASDGSFGITIPASDVSKLEETTYEVNGKVTDKAGNEAVDTEDFTVDLTPPSVEIDPIDYVNAQTHGDPLVITGKVEGVEAGTPVIVELNGEEYPTTVKGDGTFEVTIPADDVTNLVDGEDYEITATVQDKAGNEISDSEEFSVDTTVPTITLDTISTDGYINVDEYTEALVITGSTTDVEDGQTVSVNFNGKEYTGVVNDNKFSVEIPSSEISKLTNNEVYTVEASVSDKAGNATDTSKDVTVDLTVGTIDLKLDEISGGYINAAEHDEPLVIAGTTTDIEEGQTVTVSLNGKEYTTEVKADGTFEVTVPVEDVKALEDGVSYKVEASVTDAANNPTQDAKKLNVDLTAPTIVLDEISDNYVNAQEKGQDLTITGQTDAEAGQIVTVTVNGKEYTGAVASDGSFGINVPKEDVALLNEGEYVATAIVSDKAGNVSTPDEENFFVDDTAGTISLDEISGDYINANEHNEPLTITGTTTGIEPGQVVTVSLNGEDYKTTVNPDGTFEVTIPANKVGELVDGPVEVTASVKDKAGNEATTSDEFIVDTNVGTITLDDISADGYINSVESQEPLVITGRTTGIEAGQEVIVSLNGEDYKTTVKPDGSFEVTIKADDVKALAEGDYEVIARSSDKAGNGVDTVKEVTVDLSAGTITLDEISDNYINALEKNSSLSITGKTEGIEAGQKVIVNFNEVNYETIVQADGTFSVTVPVEAVQALENGKTYEAIASVADAANNATVIDKEDVIVDTTVDTIILDPISEDGYLNAQEANEPLVITGKTDGIEPGQSVTVTLNGKEYTTTVGLDGTFEVTVPVEDVQALEDGEKYEVEAKVEDKAGNETSFSSDVKVDLVTGTLVLNEISDDYLNAIEHGNDLTISGYTTGIESGQVVTITLNGKEYKGNVASDGSFGITIPASDVSKLEETTYEVNGKVTDKAGNEAVDTEDFTVDLTPPSVEIDPIDYVNAQTHGDPLVITGKVEGVEAGTPVIVELNGEEYPTTVKGDGTFEVTIPADDVTNLVDGEDYEITATVQDKAGNEISDSEEFSVDTTVPTITLDTISTDGYINVDEYTEALVITGSTTDVEDGQTVSVNFNGKEYTGVVNDNKFSVEIPSSEISKLTNNEVYTVEASVSDKAGNATDTSKDVTVDLTVGTIDLKLDEISGGYINAAEHDEPLVIAGTTTDIEEGQTVTVSLNGKEYTTEVKADGTFEVTVPVEDVKALEDGVSYKVEASVTDAANNPTQDAKKLNVDLTAPTIVLDEISDNYVNAQEKGQDLTITGQTDAEAGQIVTVTVNGKEYTGAVASDGSFGINVPKEDVALLNEGEYVATAIVSDKAGNVSTPDEENFFVDDTAGTISLDEISGDYINANEHNEPLTITGTTTGIEPGQVVTVSLNGEDYKTTVNPDGTFEVTIPANKVGELVDGPVEVTASVKDKAGNEATTSDEFIVDTNVGTITLDDISADGYINSVESQEPLVITGRTTGIEAGQEVIVSLNGEDYKTTVKPDGSFEVTIKADDVKALAEGDYEVIARSSDKAGNGVDTVKEVTVDLSAGTITLDEISDNYINALEKNSSLSITGKTEGIEAGQKVIVNFNEVNYETIVQADGTFSVTVPVEAVQALENGKTYEAIASVADAANNATVIDKEDVIVDTTVDTIILDPISEDGYLNAQEANEPLVITGKTDGIEPGQSVTVTLNGKEYTTTVGLDGTFEVTVPVEDVQALEDGEKYEVEAKVEDKAGNETSFSSDVKVDLVTGTLVLNEISDDYLNAIEHGNDLTISGYTTGIESGQVVTITLNGKEYKGNVASDGSFGITIPASDVSKLEETTYEVNGKVTDKAGNEAVDTEDFTVDLTPPSVEIDPIDYVNAQTHGDPLVITGKVEGVEAGTPVIVELNGEEYPTTVKGDGTFEVTIPADDVTNLVDGEDYEITATVQDKAGNEISDSEEFSVDTTVPTITLDTISTDGYINVDEYTEALVITGSTTDVEDGQTVSVNFNGKEYTGVVNDNKFSVEIPSSEISKLTNNEVYTVEASVSDKAGNATDTSKDVTVDLTVGTIDLKLDEISGGYINAAEHDEPLVIAGTTTDIEEGQTVTVSLNGKEYTTEVKADGTFEVTVPVEDVKALEDGVSYKVEASVTDAANNPTQDAKKLNVDLTAPTIVLDEISDNYVNAQEKGQDLTITGQTDAEAGQIVTVTVNGKEYTGAVASDGSFGINVPKEDVALLNEGEYVATAIVSDKAGNVSTPDEENFFVDDTAGTISLDEISGDYINANEHNEPLTITGTTTGIEPGQVVTVSLNGEDYKTTVNPDGTFEVTIPANKVGELVDGPVEVTASVKDKAGNEATTSDEFIVDTNVGTITLDDISADGYINSVESQEPLVITGRTTGIEAGQEVIVSLNGEDYKTTVKPDGSFEVTIKADDVKALAEGDYEVIARSSDKAGNGVDTVKEVTVDLSAGTITLDEISDNYINALEKNSSLSITGKTEGIEAGQKVIVNFNEVNYETIVQADGTFSVTVPVEAVQALENGKTYEAIASVADAANNATVIDKEDVIVDTTVDTIILDPISEDGYLNAQEANEPLVITGKTDGIEPGQSVTVTLNGKEYTTTVGLDGTFEVTVPVEDVQALEDGEKYEVEAKVEDKAGNETSFSSDVKVDLSIGDTKPVLTIKEVEDGYLNAEELEDGIQTNVTIPEGIEEGDKIVFTITTPDGTEETFEYPVTVDDIIKGNVDVTIPKDKFPEDGNYEITAKIEDEAGNSTEPSEVVEFVMDTIVSDNLAITDIVDQNGDYSSVIMYGTGVKTGEIIKLFDENGNEVASTIVDLDGKWQIDISNLTNTPINDNEFFKVIEYYENGTPRDETNVTHYWHGSWTNSNTESSDDYVFTGNGDDIINTDAILSGTNENGTVTSDNNDTNDFLVIDGGNGRDTVTFGKDLSQYDISINSKGYIVIKEDSLSDSDADGIGDVTELRNIEVIKFKDITLLDTPVLSIEEATNGISADELSNGIDSIVTLPIGTTNGDKILFDIIDNNGDKQQFEYIIQDGDIVDNKVNVVIPKDYFPADEIYEVSVVVEYKNGVQTKPSNNVDLEIDTNSGTINLDPISEDGYINAQESDEPLVITGTTTDIEEGQTVTVSLNGKEYTTEVKADGTFEVTVPVEDVKALEDINYQVKANTVDKSGNIAENSKNVIVDTTIGELKLDNISSDNYIDALEHNEPLVITGKTTDIEEGQTVIVSLNGKEYTTEVKADGTFEVTVPVEDVKTLEDISYEVKALTIDNAGNQAIDNKNITVNTNIAESLTINDLVVYEGGKATFEIDVKKLVVNSTLKLNFIDDTATVNEDYKKDVYEYSIDGGQSWHSVVNDQVDLSVGTQIVLIRVDIVDDKKLESTEKFDLSVDLISNSGNKLSAVSTVEIINNSVKANDDSSNTIQIRCCEKLVTEYAVTETSHVNESNSEVAGLSDGGYVVVWQGVDSNGSGIYSQKFDANGNKVEDAFLINTVQTGHQTEPQVTDLGNGKYLVTWSDFSTVPSSLKGQIMDGNNLMKIGEEITIADKQGIYWDPITGLEDGGFIITWSSNVAGQEDNNGFGVYGQRYDANGNVVDSKFLINQTTNGNQQDSDVTYKDGKLIVTWTGNDTNGTGVYSREFELVEQKVLSTEDFENGASGWSKAQTMDGGADTSTFLGRFGGSSGKEDVSKTYDFGVENAGKRVTIKFDFYEIDSWDGEALKVFANGLVVSTNYFYDSYYGNKDGGTEIKVDGAANTWHSEKHTIEVTAVLDENGKLKLGFGSTLNQAITDESYGIDNIVITTNTVQPTTDERVINLTQNSNQDESSITHLEDGGYVVSWTSLNQDGSCDGVYLQRYDSNGNKVGSEQVVNTYYASNQNDSVITGLNNGGYVVVWTSYGQDGSYDGVYMQRFGANGEKLGAEEQVAESTLNHQNQPSVDALEEGGFVVSWTGYNAESKTYDIFTQRYTNDGVKIIRTTDFVINEDEVFKVNTKVLLANDIDAEGDKFDIVSVQDAKDGKVELITLSNGEKEVVFTPKEGYFGKTSFTYTIEDEHGATDTATVTFEVLSDGINDRVYHLEENESVDIDELKQADILDMSNNSKDNVKINLEDIILDNDSHKELVIKGEIGDIIELDKPATDWVKGQTQQIDGKNYNVYTNATVKLLIEDDIDVTPDI